jgi:hypothetical protein
MRKLLSIFFMIMVCGAFAETTSDFYFSYGPGIKSITFAYTGEYDDSQTLEGVKTFNQSGKNGYLQIQVTSDLVASTQVASSFNNLFAINSVVHDKNIFGLSTKEATPEELNFWIGGYLYVNGNNLTYPVYLGQAPKDYWWIGNKNGNSKSYPFVINDGQGTVVCFTTFAKNQLYVSLNDC